MTMQYTLGVAAASRRMGKSGHRVRQLCRENRLAHVRDGRGRFMINAESCDAYAPMQTSVVDRKMVIYCDTELRGMIDELLDDLGDEVKARAAFAVANPGKKKEDTDA